MPDWDILVGAVITPIGIQADVKAQVTLFCFKKWVACCFTEGNVTIVTTGIGNGMAHLTG